LKNFNKLLSSTIGQVIVFAAIASSRQKSKLAKILFDSDDVVTVIELVLVVVDVIDIFDVRVVVSGP
jgi:hypothetical protein